MASSSTRICRLRSAQGLRQVELARRCGISRQALGAIEAGIYQPGVSVAMKLARELGETVESLFGGDESHQCAAINAVLTSAGATAADGASGRVALGRIGGKLAAVPEPRPGLWLAPAGGRLQQISGRQAAVQTFHSSEEIDSTLLLAGCDPSVSILIDRMARNGSKMGIVVLPSSSRKSLDALAAGAVHAAGVHLRGGQGGEYNLEPVRRAAGEKRMVLFNFASWEVGLAAAKSGPRRISKLADLERPDVRIINRESGSGARQALDEALAEAGMSAKKITGYEDELGGHLEVAEAVANGRATTGVTIRVAAEAYGLGFIPLREERYDLVIAENELESTPVRRMLDVLRSRRFSDEVAQLCAYDTSRMGDEAARVNC